MKIPKQVLLEFEESLDNLGHFFNAYLKVTTHDGKVRFQLSYEKSMIVDKAPLENGKEVNHDLGKR